jgi:hypothetical protein
MDQPSAGLAIQGLLSHILVEDYSDIQKKLADSNSTTNGNKDAENLVDKLEDNSKAGGDESEIDSSQDEKARNVVAFYKLEMIRIQLITAQGDQTEVEVEDVRKAQPDAIAHASAEIISRLEESGDKITEALKSLCWRHNSIQAEEVKLIGIDSLGFDLRLCAGAKIESLRFAFSTRVHPFFLSCFKILFLIYDILRNRADIIIDGINISCQSKLLQATSEENAEGQIRKLLFPKTNQSTQPKPK